MTEAEQESTVWLGEDHLDRVIIRRGKAAEISGDRLAARRHAPPALERGDCVFRREVRAVVELDALAQRDGERHSVGGNVHIRRREARDVGVLFTHGVEILVNVTHDVAVDVGSTPHHVDGGEVTVDRNLQRSATFACSRGRLSRGGRRGCLGGCGRGRAAR